MVEFGKPLMEHLMVQYNPENPVQAVKQGYLVQLTGEQLADAQVWPVQVYDPEKARADREARWKAEAEQAKRDVAQTTLRLATAHPALMPVIDHHSPELSEYGTVSCQGCDAGAYAEDDPGWPCSTIELILDGLGPHMAGGTGG